MKEQIDIIMSTCNRKDFTKRTIEAFYSRLENPDMMRLIIIDDSSVDGTLEYLKELKSKGLIDVLVSRDFKHLCEIYNEGFKYVETEYFIVVQDDLIIPKLEPDVVEQLIALMKKYPDHGGISCRIQRLPNMKWLDGDLTPARKALSACFRIQKKSDIEKVGGFGSRHRDEIAFTIQMNKIGKKCSWANDLWCDHIGHCVDRGYEIKPKKWGIGIHSRMLSEESLKRKPYPKVDHITNKPLKGEKIYK